jgi:hypothetical protein
MDYLGPMYAPSNLKIISLFIDFENCRAVVPGDGTMPMVLTHSQDVGRFVAAALSLDKWTEMSLIVGDRITLNGVVNCAQEVKGT